MSGLHEDPKGNLWLGSNTGVWRWKPGPPQFYALPNDPSGVQGIAEGEDGAALVTTAGGIRRLIGGTSQVAFPLPASVRGLARGMLRDRDGGLWVGTAGKGLVHLHQGRTDVFSQPDGLTGDFISNFFEDREGSVSVLPYAVLASKEGAIWLEGVDGPKPARSRPSHRVPPAPRPRKGGGARDCCWRGIARAVYDVPVSVLSRSDLAIFVDRGRLPGK